MQQDILSEKSGVDPENLEAFTSPKFVWTVPVSIDNIADSLLSATKTTIPEDSSIPPEIIAEQLRGTPFQAEIERPLHLGSHDGRSAYRLLFYFSFQHSRSRPRIRTATITITFRDAPEDTKQDSDDEDEPSRHPAILDFYPKVFEGPVRKATVERSAEATIGISNHSILNTRVKIGEKKILEEEGRLTMHGTTRGRPKHRVIWTIRENEVSKTGIPITFHLPLIVMPQNGRRFSAVLGLRANYGIRRGLLAKIIPVLGSSPAPIYFDPAVLDKMAKNRDRSRFDGKVVVEEVGDLTHYNLRDHSSF
jgi:hypothetical protein